MAESIVPASGTGESLGESDDPTELRYVGPATADVIEQAPFDAAAVSNRTVSYEELIEAGVNPGVAGKLRREYSLVWSFEWISGAHLRRRAKNVGGLDAEQREWIVSSSSGDSRSNDSGNRTTAAEQAWRDRSNWLNGTPETNCERCGEELVTLRLGESQSVQCEACGFVGVSVRW